MLEVIGFPLMTIHTGRHFLQIPGPTNVPDCVLREIAMATIDHRGPEFAELGLEVLDRLRGVFRTRGPVVVFPASGTGAAEAALVNTLSPGDRILIFETGWFSHIAWRQVAERLGLTVEYVPGTWRHGASPETLEQRLRDDAGRDIKAVLVVHNETSTGVTSRIGDLRRAMNRTGHPALLIIDEGLAVGDAHFSAKCLERIRAFRRQGKTLLMVSHDMASVRDFCSRAIWLRRGGIVADGPVASVLRRYEAAIQQESLSDARAERDEVVSQI